MKRIFVGPSHLQSEFYRVLRLREGDFLLNVTYTSIESLLESLTVREDLSSLREKLKSMDLTIFRRSIDDDDFLKEVLSIREDLLHYHTPIDSLHIEEELKQILKNTEVSYDESFFDQDLSSYTVLDADYPLYEQKVIEKMKRQGASVFSFEKKDNISTLSHLTNIREEAEAVAQYLITNDLPLEDCGVILCDLQNEDLYLSVFDRYHIPVNAEKEENGEVLRFVALIDYFLDPNTETLRQVFNANVLSNADTAINLYLLRHFPEDGDIRRPFERFRNDDKCFSHLEDRAEEKRKEISSLLEELQSSEDLLSAFSTAFNALEEGEEKDSIASFLQNIFSKDITKENYPNIRSSLLKLRRRKNYISSLSIGNLSSSTYTKDYLFVLDATADHYPGFKALSSLLHEDDVKGTDYPDILERQNAHQACLSYLKRASRTFYLYPETTYEGRSIDPAYELSALAEFTFPLLQNEVFYTPAHTMDPSLVQKDLYPKGIMRASVSSIERYFHCPYSYFLNYVLKLRKPDDQSLQASTIGSLLHHFMEVIAKKYGKNYAEYTKEDIEEVLDPEIGKLLYRYPRDAQMILFAKENLIRSLNLLKEFLQGMEAETDFEVRHEEYPFEHIILEKNGIKLSFNGIIDRIDEYNDLFRILDYKSSKKTLSLKEVSTGEKLQLFTYAMIYEEETHKEPTAVYYVTLNTGLLSNPYYTYSTKEGLKLLDKQGFEEFRNTMKLKGIAFGDYKYLYSSLVSITSPTKKTTIDFSQVKEGILAIYSHLLDEISAGHFPLAPSEGACTFCDYHGICHYSSLHIEKEAIYPFNED